MKVVRNKNNYFIKIEKKIVLNNFLYNQFKEII